MSDARLLSDPSSALSARSAMAFEPPEIIYTSVTRIACDGSGDVPAALGHPRIWLQMDASDFVDCPYCDRQFILSGGAFDRR